MSFTDRSPGCLVDCHDAVCAAGRCRQTIAFQRERRNAVCSGHLVQADVATVWSQARALHGKADALACAVTSCLHLGGDARLNGEPIMAPVLQSLQIASVIARTAIRSIGPTPDAQDRRRWANSHVVNSLEA
jgi:hypothetical protein